MKLAKLGFSIMKAKIPNVHLSTLLILFLVSSCLLGVNFMPRTDREFHGCLSDLGAYEVFSYGWPAPILWTFVEEKYDPKERIYHWSHPPLYFNIIISSVILLGIWFILDARISSKKAGTGRPE